MDQSLEELLNNLKSRIGKNLQEDQKGEVLKVLRDSISCFALDEDDLGHCTLVEHDINTGLNPPIHQLPYKSAWKERAVIKNRWKGCYVKK